MLALLAVGVLGGSALVASAAEASSTESPSFYGLSKRERRLCEPSFYGLASPECDLHEHDVHLDHPRHHDHASDTLPPETCISMFGRRDAPFSGTWNGTKFGYFTIPRFFNALANENTTLTTYKNVFGVPVFCTAGFDLLCHHVAALLAGIIDNDSDGCADDHNVITKLTSFFTPPEQSRYASKRRHLLMHGQGSDYYDSRYGSPADPATPGAEDDVPHHERELSTVAHPALCVFQEASHANTAKRVLLDDGPVLFEGCQAVSFEDSKPMCGGQAAGLNDCIDNSFQSVLALVTKFGLAKAYPPAWGTTETQDPPSRVQEYTDLARGGRFTGTQAPRPYPANATFSGYGSARDYGIVTGGCDYACHVTKFIFWVITTLKGGTANKVGIRRWYPVNNTNDTHTYPVYTQEQCDAPACNMTCGNQCSEWQPRYRQDVISMLPDVQPFFETSPDRLTTMVLFSEAGVLPLGTYRPTTYSLWTTRTNKDGSPATRVPRPLPTTLAADGVSPKPGAGTRQMIELGIRARERRGLYAAEGFPAGTFVNAPFSPGFEGAYVTGTRGVAPATYRRRLGDARSPESVNNAHILPTITDISPAHGPSIGGTRVTVHGGPFRAPRAETVAFGKGPRLPQSPESVYPGGTANPQIRLRFAMRGAAPISVGALEVRSSNEAVFESPPSPRESDGLAQLTVSNDGGKTYSHVPLATVQGGGTFAFFEYMHPLLPNTLVYHAHSEKPHIQLSMSIDNTTGPYTGGTLVTISLGCYTPYPLPVEEIVETFYGLNVTVPPDPPPPPPAPPVYPPRDPYQIVSMLTFYGMDPWISYLGPGYNETTLKRTVDLCNSTRGILNWTTPFLPSKHLKCQFRSLQNPQNGTNHTELFFLNDIVPAEYISPTQIRCYSPPMPGSRADRTVTVPSFITVSNDGTNFTDDAFSIQFNYTTIFPKVDHIFTTSHYEASFVKARGPLHGRTEVYINGTDFLPSDQLLARFRMEIPESTTGEHPEVRELEKFAPCVFDHTTQIRCISPPWEDGVVQAAANVVTPQEISGYHPGFKVEVDISNDGGLRYSLPNKDRFIYADLYVSGSGSDIFGDGTKRFGFRSIGRAMQAALGGARSYHSLQEPFANQTTLDGMISGRYRIPRYEKLSVGLGNYINSDKIVLQDGTYSDVIGLYGFEQNVMIVPQRKLVVLTAENRGAASIRCSDTSSQTPQHPFSAPRGKMDFDMETHGVLYLDGIGVVNCSPAFIYEHYDTKRRPWERQIAPRAAWWEDVWRDPFP